MGKQHHTPATPQDEQPGDAAFEPFRMPSHYFQDTVENPTESSETKTSDADNCTPIIAFINAGSGGHIGEKLADLLRRALGKAQVFEVGKNCSPEHVLGKLWANFAAAAQKGDKQAEVYRSQLRILAGGGDGTIAWVLNSVRKLGLEPCPAAAVVPLGTGNGLSINFGWGKTVRPNWIMSDARILQELRGIAAAEVRGIDIWHTDFVAPRRSFYAEDDIPAALSVSDEGSGEAPTGAAQMLGEFCYYFTFGLDAEAAHRFDSLRKHKPRLTQKRKINIFWYMWFIVRTGWFCGASPLNEKIAKLEIKNKDGEWLAVELGNTIRALIIINLQTYSGGRDVWGLKDERPTEGVAKGFVPPIFDDGLLEIVGLEGGFTSWAALSGIWKNLHGKRVAQAREIRIVYHSPKEKKGVAMRMDGEPWWQTLPDKEGEEITVHIKHSGCARMLLNTTFLPGVTKRLLAIAEREKQLSSPSERS